jgi:DNA-directed RNA polymerase specialized sigma24 family protein
MSKSKPKPKSEEKFRIDIARQLLRNYLQLKAHFAQYGDFLIEYKGLEISYLDLKGCLEDLSPRLQDAVYYNVILDLMQKDAAEKMGVASASVNLYVSDACRQVARRLWG